MKISHPINHTNRSDWQYHDSKESSRPGYLARRFAQIRKQMAEPIKQSAKVRKIK